MEYEAFPCTQVMNSELCLLLNFCKSYKKSFRHQLRSSILQELIPGRMQNTEKDCSTGNFLVFSATHIYANIWGAAYLELDSVIRSIQRNLSTCITDLFNSMVSCNCQGTLPLLYS